MIRKRYKYGHAKAFNVSYDDGVLQDERLVKLLNTYGIIGTFNLNTGLILNDFSWNNESGISVKRLPRNKLKDIYEGHEIASHSYSHPFLLGMDKESILKELSLDKEILENWLNREIYGFAYPFAEYNELTTECVKQIGFKYARIGNEPRNYTYSKDPYLWSPSFYHLDEGLIKFTEEFINSSDELALCQITGHTYDFDFQNNWDDIENVLQMVSKCSNIWFSSTFEIIEYLHAMDKVEIKESIIINNSDEDLWFDNNGKNLLVKRKSKLNY